MIRFRVVRASRLLLVFSVLLLIGVLTWIAMNVFAVHEDVSLNTSASLVSAATGETETSEVFASSARRLGAAPEDSPIEIEILSPRASTSQPPRILIYHTHTHEAYEQVSEDPYEALEAWRTNDADHSVVRVGAELAAQLRQYGFEVVHDETDHENDALSTAYERSLRTLEGYSQPFDLYIDLHRDAYVSGETVSVPLDDGETSAQVMLLIGNGNGFEVKPNYQENLAFAEALEARINALHPGLCRKTLVKDGRYNQHIGVHSILIEVGHNRNTLREALNVVPDLSRAIYSLMMEDDQTE